MATIGKEKPKLKAKEVVVQKITSETREPRDGGKLKESKEILIFHVKHPDREQLLEISTVKYEQTGGKMKSSALWFTPDEEGCIPFESGLAHLMRHYEVEDHNDLVGKKLATTTSENGFLILKAY